MIEKLIKITYSAAGREVSGIKSIYKKILSLLLVGIIINLHLPFGYTALAATERLYGMDRYRTAVAISQKGWASSTYAVLARGDDFPDALCAGPFAKMKNAPILLTETDRLNSYTLAELKRLGVSHVYIIGGYGAVSWSVENSLRNAGIAGIERIYGSDRYETSVKIAEKMGWPGKIALATGENYPDALSISSIAAQKGMPILLTTRNSLPAGVSKYIKDKAITQTYIAGGTGVISNLVRSNVPGPVRLSGDDRFKTNVAVMEYFANELDFSNVYVAIGEGPRGDEFADALTGAVLASKTSSPLILTGKTLPAATANYIRTKLSPISKVTALGGEGVVPSSVVNAIENYIDGSQSYIAASYNYRGTYGPYQGIDTIRGDVYIGVDGVTLQNTIINGNLILGEGIGSGTVYLRNVTVTGTTTVKGGGPNSIYLYDFDSQYMIVNTPSQNNVRLFAQGNSDINHVTMRSRGRLEESGVSGTGFNTVVVDRDSDVYLYGKFGTVSLEGSSAVVNLESGSIGTLKVETSASNSRITLSSSTYVDVLTVNAKTTVYGTGHIYRADINADDTTIQSTPSLVNIQYGKEAYIGGQLRRGSDYNYNYGYTVTLYRISDYVTINAGESYYAYQNINNINGATLTYYSSNSNVTVDYHSGLIYSSTPGASAEITVYGNIPGWNSASTSFTVYISGFKPVVSGVQDGRTYSGPVTIGWTEGTNTNIAATLTKNGGTPQIIQSGYKVTEDGNYVLEITCVSMINGYKTTTRVSFTIDSVAPNAPVIKGVEDGKIYGTDVTPTWDDAAGTTSTATLKKDGGSPQEYKKGDAIKDHGTYELVVTAKKTSNGLTAETKIGFTIDKTPPEEPTITGVEEGKVYTKAVKPDWTIDVSTTTSTVLLLRDGKEVEGYAKGQEISDNGEYELKVTVEKLLNHLTASKTVKFTIDKDPPPNPVVDGVKNNETYTGPVTITWDDIEGATIVATLTKNKADPEIIQKGAKISESGEYTLTVIATKKRNELSSSTTINFIIKDK